eukprot:PhM_4_TR14114/c2_g3_i4/m.42920
MVGGMTMFTQPIIWLYTDTHPVSVQSLPPAVHPTGKPNQPVTPTLFVVFLSVLGPSEIDGTLLTRPPSSSSTPTAITMTLIGDQWADGVTSSVLFRDILRVVSGPASDWTSALDDITSTSVVHRSINGTTLTLELGYSSAFFTEDGITLGLDLEAVARKAAVSRPATISPWGDAPLYTVRVTPPDVPVTKAMSQATLATTTTAAVLAAFNPMSAAALQTVAVIGSMPCSVWIGTVRCTAQCTPTCPSSCASCC